MYVHVFIRAINVVAADFSWNFSLQMTKNEDPTYQLDTKVSKGLNSCNLRDASTCLRALSSLIFDIGSEMSGERAQTAGPHPARQNHR